MVSICPNCGARIKDEHAIYCPYCAKRLVENPHKRELYLALGVLFTVIGVSIVLLIEPKIDPRFSPFPTAPVELFGAGVLNIVVGIIFIAYAVVERKRAKSS